jgi:hypothetical protein
MRCSHAPARRIVDDAPCKVSAAYRLIAMEGNQCGHRAIARNPARPVGICEAHPPRWDQGSTYRTFDCDTSDMSYTMSGSSDGCEGRRSGSRRDATHDTEVVKIESKFIDI